MFCDVTVAQILQRNWAFCRSMILPASSVECRNKNSKSLYLFNEFPLASYFVLVNSSCFVLSKPKSSFDKKSGPSLVVRRLYTLPNTATDRLQQFLSTKPSKKGCLFNFSSFYDELPISLRRWALIKRFPRSYTSSALKCFFHRWVVQFFTPSLNLSKMITE